MSDAFPNSIREGVPDSPDLRPVGPDENVGAGGISQDSADKQYGRLPDIVVPKHKAA